MGMADDVIEGIFCQECGCYIDDGDAPGHPRYCKDCGGDPETNYATKKQRKRSKSRKRGRR